MTVEQYFEEWWAPKELPQNGFNKTAMLDFAEMYHKQALRIHDVVGRSEQLRAFSRWYEENYQFQISDRAIKEYERYGS